MQAGRAHHLNRRTFLKALGATAGVWLFGQHWVHGQQTLTVGVLGGSSLPLGQGIINGAQLAADELKFKVIIGDLGNEADPARARSVFVDLVRQGSDVVIGLSRPDTIPGLLLDIPRLKKPFVITGAASLGTDQVAGDFANFKYIFRAGMVNSAAQAFDGGEFGREFLVARLIKEKVLPSNKVALIGDPSKQSADFRTILLSRLSKAGLDVVGNISDQQPSVLLERLQKISVPAALTAFFDTRFGADFTTAWSANKVKVALFGWNEALLSDDLKGAAAGYVVTDFAAEAPKVGLRTLSFYKGYQARFNGRPISTAATSYDAVYALADALERARTTDAEAMVNALERTRFAGAVGLIRFYGVEEQQRDPLKLAVAHDQVYGINRLADKALVLPFDGVRPFYTQISANGQRVVLYPYEYATGSYVLPPHFG